MNEGQLHIRPYREQDYDQLVHLWQTCGLTRPWNDPAQDITLCLQTESSALLVGVCADRLVGSVMTGSDGHRGWLYYLAIEPDVRGRGFARALVRHAEGWLTRQGVRKVELMIRPDNDAVRAFYERIGYAVEPRQVMSRWLKPASGQSGHAQTDCKLEMTITYLEMRAPPAGRSAAAPPGASMVLAERPTTSFYRYLYDTVGAPWLWYERRLLDDRALAAIVQDKRVQVRVLYLHGVPTGYAELDGRRRGEVELAYLGLLPEFFGRGLGSYLIDHALRQAWRARPRRVWVHTCNFDHPRALLLYQRAGFVPYKQETVLIDDPRRNGTL